MSFVVEYDATKAAPAVSVEFWVKLYNVPQLRELGKMALYLGCTSVGEGKLRYEYAVQFVFQAEARISLDGGVADGVMCRMRQRATITAHAVFPYSSFTFYVDELFWGLPKPPVSAEVREENAVVEGKVIAALAAAGVMIEPLPE